MKRLYFLTIFVFTLSLTSFGQTSVFNADIAWEDISSMDWIEFQIEDTYRHGLAVQVPLPEMRQKVKLQVLETEVLALDDIQDPVSKTEVSEDFVFEYDYASERHQYVLTLQFAPYRRLSDNLVERILSYEIITGGERQDIVPMRDPPVFADNSILREGDIYKIGVRETGMYRLRYRDLEELGIDMSAMDSRRINLYGNGYGPMPQDLSESRPDDLRPVPIQVFDGGDGQWDPGDYLLFYARDAHRWYWDEQENMFLRRSNVYDIESYYFVKVELDNQSAVRIQDQALPDPSAGLVDSYTDRRTIEEDVINLLHQSSVNHGSGQNWYGTWFNGVREFDYSPDFVFPNAEIGSTAKYLMEFAGRSDQSSTVYLDLAGETYTRQIGNTSINVVEGQYARSGVLRGSFEVPSTEIPTSVRYPSIPSAEVTQGWLDFITMNVESSLKMRGSEMSFFLTPREDSAVYTLRLDEANESIEVWDVSIDLNTMDTRMTSSLTGNALEFKSLLGPAKEFVAFLPASVQRTPNLYDQVPNQDLHSLREADVLLVYPSALRTQAMRWKDYRESQSELKIAAVEIGDVYNEFSGGIKDPTAVRDLARMLYERSEDFKYLLLFGSASFDSRGVYSDLRDQDFVPTFETLNSLNAISSHPSDDYFALLDDDEGADLVGRLDIAVGRMPCRDLQEAETMIDRLIRYETSTASQGDWRIRVGLVGDDEDDNAHIDGSEIMSGIIEDLYPFMNQEKIYLDAYPQQSTSGGQRYPIAQQEMNAAINKGWLLTTYIGHGGPLGWAQERVLTNADILSWTNADRPTIMLTATCSFMPFDDAEITSSGENVLLSPTGGAVALLSTVRAVFSNSNERLTAATFREIFQVEDGQPRSIGEVLRLAKNAESGSSNVQRNSRRYMLFGDPTMKVPVPPMLAQTTEINGLSISEWGNEQSENILQSLDEVSVEGIITNADGELASDYHGSLFVTIFDKPRTITTLINDQGSREKEFNVRRNIVYKGIAEVQQGRFEYSFVVPADIDLSIGEAKISYYASSEDQPDAKGAELVMLGGTSSDPVQDDSPPIIEVYLNALDFQSGDQVAPEPLLISFIEDDFGINVTGNSIGHDITAVIDDNTQETIVLNSFFEPLDNSSNKGEVRFRLGDLEDGPHTLTLKAWDIANNSGQATIDFIIASDLGISLEELFASPNPVVDYTDFGFDHNYGDARLEITVTIYDMQGRVVDIIETTQLSEDGTVEGIRWQASELPFLTSGAYLYNIEARVLDQNNGRSPSAYAGDKLILIRR